MKPILNIRKILALVCALAFLTASANANTSDDVLLLPSVQEGTLMLLLAGRADGNGHVPAVGTMVTQNVLGLTLDQAGDELVDRADMGCFISLSLDKGFQAGEWVIPFACVLFREGENRLVLPLYLGDY